MSVRLEASSLCVGYGERLVVDTLDLSIVGGTVTAVIGPNGCGKSTLLRALGRLLPARSGAVLLDGKQIDRMSTREVARVLGLLPQAPSAPEVGWVLWASSTALLGGAVQEASRCSRSAEGEPGSAV